MIRTVILAVLALVALAPNVQARQHHRPAIVAHQRCNIDWPCEGVIASPRGEHIVKALGGFGSAQKIYAPRSELVPHPTGCPHSAFCGCGAAVRVFGAPVRSLWLAAAWFRFPRAAPAPGMVAVRRHHVFVLEAQLAGAMWRVYDANSGGHATRVHARSIAGYVVVDPRGGRA